MKATNKTVPTTRAIVTIMDIRKSFLRVFCTRPCRLSFHLCLGEDDKDMACVLLQRRRFLLPLLMLLEHLAHIGTAGATTPQVRCIAMQWPRASWLLLFLAGTCGVITNGACYGVDQLVQAENEHRIGHAFGDH